MEELNKYLFIFDEGYGTEYERYALDRFVSRMVDKYSISKVLEMPANGIMGIPGIKSLIFAELGCEVTVAHPSKEFLENAKKIWDAFGLDANFVKSNWINTGFNDDSFDLVWNFCVFEHFDDPKRVIQEMLRVTKRYIFIEIQNVFNPGFPIHRIYHFVRREPWDHGSLGKMKLSRITTIINELNATTVETGATDMPPWPDINIRLKEMVSKKAPDIILNEDTESASKLRPAVTIKPIVRIINDIHLWDSAPSRAPPVPSQAPEGLTRKPCKGLVEILFLKNEIVLLLFDIWYRLVESKAPASVKKFFAHHPYVIAEKRRCQ
jgi:SAM-dependent methyltransferase